MCSCTMQVHLGFYEKEEQAAAAYDRAAINKGAKDGNKIVTNFNFNDYLAEIPMLYHLSQDELVSALGSERCTLPLLVRRPVTSTSLHTLLVECVFDTFACTCFADDS